MFVYGQACAWPFSVFLLLLQNRFIAQYCQISTDLDTIFCTPIVVVRNSLHLWADLDRDRRVGGYRPNHNDYIFENL